MQQNQSIAYFSIGMGILVLLGLGLMGCNQISAPSPTPAPLVKAAPPWFAADAASCQLSETNTQSRGDQYEYDSTGKNTNRFLPPGQATCRLEIQVCSDIVVRQQVVSAGEKCPLTLHFSYAPKTKVCCSLWNAAKVSKTPCDPLLDADCDGVPTMLDTYPLDYKQQ